MFKTPATTYATAGLNSEHQQIGQLVIPPRLESPPRHAERPLPVLCGSGAASRRLLRHPQVAVRRGQAVHHSDLAQRVPPQASAARRPVPQHVEQQLSAQSFAPGEHRAGALVLQVLPQAAAGVREETV